MDEAYVERVLSAVEAIPPGRVLAYGEVAARVGGGPRTVGRVMALYGAAVPWWRVVRADGRPAAGHEPEALRRLTAEGCPLRSGRVDRSGEPTQPDPVSARPDRRTRADR